MTASKKIKFGRSFFISLLIHVILIAVLATVAVHIYEKHRGSADNGQLQAIAARPDINIDTVKTSLQKEEARVAELSDEDKMSELRKKSAVLQNMNPQAVDAVAAAAETLGRANKSRAYEPVKNVAGNFDTDTAAIYDISRENRDEQPVFIYTLVDAKGRTMKAERRMDEMSADDMRAYHIFEMSRGNKNMARLLRSAIMIGQPQADDATRQSPAAAAETAK
ncbi:MAG TPA: hypothetical protein PKK48_05095 [Phycisphaerae bacterium]|nr:hypothetical protein [Phycisphaerae bacterium]HPS53358.1 hypothetical protein [Phycisphaerae bacterium]